ncbi:MAG TPA: glycosyltransferase [Bacteroidales bacterium]|nr:glycosyltransferase [Bacteroidales bacterium]
MCWLPTILILPYLFLLLKIYRSLLKIELFNISVDTVTFVSVVVACRNEEESLPFLLKSFEKQNYPDELFEVIIVNDNSTDKTYGIATGYSGVLNLKAVNNKGKGKKQAIRTGIENSSGNLIITTDADCLMKEGWIRTISAFFEKHKPDMIICPVKLESGSGFFKKFQEMEFLSLQGISAGSAFSGEATMCNGANLAFTRRSYFDHYDNLHEEIDSGDDIFFLQSLKHESGSKIFWLESTDAIVTTALSPSVVSFIKQRRRWISKGKAYNDTFTISLAIVTFVTIILQVSVLIAGFINRDFWWIFLTIFLLKTIPDLLIIRNRARSYGTRKLLNWFLPALVVYPFYVLGVVFYSWISRKNKEY